MKKTFLFLSLFAGLAGVFTSCSKTATDVPNNSALTTTSSNSRVKILAVTPGASNSFEIVGHWADPTLGAAGFGSIPYNLVNNDSTHTPAQIRFTGFFNSYIVRKTTTPQTYIGYVDKPSSTLATLTLSDVTSGFVAAWSDSIGYSAAYNSFKGYYTYDPVTHVPVPIANRYVIVSNNATIGSATEVYAIQITSLPSQTSGSLDKADVYGAYKLF